VVGTEVEEDDGVGIVGVGVGSMIGAATGSRCVCLTGSGMVEEFSLCCRSRKHFEQRFEVTGLPKNPHPLEHKTGALGFCVESPSMK